MVAVVVVVAADNGVHGYKALFPPFTHTRLCFTGVFFNSLVSSDSSTLGFFWVKEPTPCRVIHTGGVGVYRGQGGTGLSERGWV